MSPIPALFLPLPAGPPGAWGPARPTFLSLRCLYPTSLCLLPPSGAFGEGVGAGEGTRSRGKGVAEGTQAGEGVAIQFPELVGAIQVVWR